MAWYPGAVKMELQPESDAQPAIRPTQLIFHSIVGPWTPRRTYEFWRDSSTLESHFGLGYDGDIAQYIGTETRADANAAANRRPDGTGAISCETASNTSASDPWTAAQIEQLIRLGAWAHQRHEIPLRICRSWSDPGFGYHSLFPQWSTSGTACPGKARIEQFKTVVFPGIVARATGKTTTPEEDEMQLNDQVILGPWVKERWPDDPGLADGKIAVNTALGSGYAHARTASTLARVAASNSEKILAQLAAQAATIDKLVDAVAAGPGADLDALKAEIRSSIEGIRATILIDVQEG
jgi:hypothetical protein